MRPASSPLPPSSSLPPLRTLDSLTGDTIFDAIRNLSRIYCPLSFHLEEPHSKKPVDEPLVDSGYTSGSEDDKGDALTALRADGFERSFAERWLTGFLARAEELSCLTSDEARERAVEDASCVLESFYTNSAEDEQKQEELADYVREFTFDVRIPGRGQGKEINFRLNDGLAGQNPEEPDDVGLQSWGASVVISNIMCAEPDRFGFSRGALGPSPRIIDLGAGTGLVSLVLAQLLPQLGISGSTVIATDYHPAVLENLRANVAANSCLSSPGRLEVAALDWSAPTHEAPLDKPADVLLATDVVYAAEHAVWLRDCATGLLAPEGIFWLIATVRDTGRFDGVSDTVVPAFAAEDRPVAGDGRRLTILNEERLEKRNGIGRGDESGYKIFRIGWA